MIGKAIFQGDITLLKEQLKVMPELANQAIAQGEKSAYRVHPIHRVCDAVFEKKITETTALEMVRLLVTQGADVNGKKSDTTSMDSPLITASSLYCDTIAIYLIEQGADPSPRGTHGGTALHWASWTGSAEVVARLLEGEVAIDDQGDEFQSTPILWAINGWLNTKKRNHRAYPEVVAQLLEAGADPNAVNGDGKRALELISSSDDPALFALLNDKSREQ